MLLYDPMVMKFKFLLGSNFHLVFKFDLNYTSDGCPSHVLSHFIPHSLSLCSSLHNYDNKLIEFAPLI